MAKDDFLNLDFYEYMLLEPLSLIYSAIEKSSENWLNYSYLLIGKFAIHSSSFYHLSRGIIENRNSGEKIKSYGYDLFTVNTTFRAILETYATFNHIFIEPLESDEKEFRFLLWKIDGLKEKLKYQIKESDFKEAKQILENDKSTYQRTIEEIENCSFYKSSFQKEMIKIYNPEKKQFKWKFLNESGIFKPITITKLVEHTCITRGFINSYRHASTHTHSSYLAIEEFERYRGKPMPEYYFKPIIKLAIFITSMIIYDICSVDKNSKDTFSTLPKQVQDFIIGMTININQNKKHIWK